MSDKLPGDCVFEKKKQWDSTKTPSTEIALFRSLAETSICYAQDAGRIGTYLVILSKLKFGFKKIFGLLQWFHL